VREVLPRAAHFPDALVGGAPARLDVLDHLALERPRGLLGLEPAAACDVHAVDELAEDVELELTDRRVADPHRARAFVPGEPVEDDLQDAPLARGAVQRL
jgi:hypothetical protein